MPVVLAVLYPILVHLAILLSLPFLQAVALISLATSLCYGGLKNKNIFLWVFLVVFSVVLLVSASLDLAVYFLYLSSVAIPLLLGVVFINTLLPGREPLVTAIAEAARLGELSAELRVYTKSVTIMWSCFFCAMIIELVLLAVLGDPEMWSWMSNIFHYVIAGVMFVGEFIYRKWRFPDYGHPSFIEYIKIVAQKH